jgi:hypothetical protein
MISVISVLGFTMSLLIGSEFHDFSAAGKTGRTERDCAT